MSGEINSLSKVGFKVVILIALLFSLAGTDVKEDTRSVNHHEKEIINHKVVGRA